MPKTKTIVIFLLAVMFATMIGSSWGDSGIEDERPHIVAGYSYLTTGDYRINPEHPPLIKDLAALPLVLKSSFTFPFDYWRANLNSQWELGSKFLYDSGNNPDEIFFLARLPIILLSLVLGYLVFIWAKDLYGEKAGLFALFLYAFDANIIAHSRFVTTDLGISFAIFLNLYFVWKFFREPVMKYFLLAGLTFGVVLITKFSAALLVPIYFLIFVLEMIKGRDGKAEDRKFSLLFDKSIIKRGLGNILSFTLIGLIGLVVMYLFYVPHVINMSSETAHALVAAELPNHNWTPIIEKLYDTPLMKPFAHYLLGFSMVSGHVMGGHRVFFMGNVANGFRPYYIIAFLIKTAIPTLIFLFSMLFLMFRKNIKERNLDYDKLYLLIPFAVFYGMALQGSINLGIRYLLPVFPFIFVFVSDFANKVDLSSLSSFWRRLGVQDQKGEDSGQARMTAAVGSALFIVLLVWYALGSLNTYPHYLAYFNESIGGPKNGAKYITDSNIDWGQDLKRLAKYVDDNKINSIAIDYFGSGRPSYYIPSSRQWKGEMGKPQGYFAISASTYSQVTGKFKDTGEDVNPGYIWLRDEKPVANIGYSILVFNVK
ncbi:hypothetical protein COY62_00250 [bacterium (Candidatus Howlettbacteria) CG_4_10_14_0_8_um_filter_40_9]|nr:MAG: hypothetical protein COY62_00250 [bacterium (Candidatus Howlettbacteria) CG_4_10_14_0_8_um_filter_40_9]